MIKISSKIISLMVSLK